MQLNLRQSHKLAEMFYRQPAVPRLIKDFTNRFVEMVHSESFDLTTIEFEAVVPKNDPDKVVLVLQRAEYADGPLILPEEDIKSANYKLVRHIQSLYTAFLAKNPLMFGFVEACPGFSDCLFLICSYLLERFGDSAGGARGHYIEVGDNIAGDLVFYIKVVR